MVSVSGQLTSRQEHHGEKVWGSKVSHFMMTRKAEHRTERTRYHPPPQHLSLLNTGSRHVPPHQDKIHLYYAVGQETFVACHYHSYLGWPPLCQFCFVTFSVGCTSSSLLRSRSLSLGSSLLMSRVTFLSVSQELQIPQQLATQFKNFWLPNSHHLKIDTKMPLFVHLKLSCFHKGQNLLGYAAYICFAKFCLLPPILDFHLLENIDVLRLYLFISVSLCSSLKL